MSLNGQSSQCKLALSPLPARQRNQQGKTARLDISL
jgi:hypothetical protein